MNITEIIKPITLLSGPHPDTAQTGQGCFMNVVAYLNGEAQITDQSDCVCYVMRPLLIFANDFMMSDERQQLVPFIERAMGSRTDDKEIITKRLARVVAFANQQAKSANSAKYAANSAAEYAANSAAKYAAESAEYAAESAEYAANSPAKYAAECAKYAAKFAECAVSAVSAEYHSSTVSALLELFDEGLPLAPEWGVQIEARAQQFVKLTERS